MLKISHNLLDTVIETDRLLLAPISKNYREIIFKEHPRAKYFMSGGKHRSAVATILGVKVPCLIVKNDNDVVFGTVPTHSRYGAENANIDFLTNICYIIFVLVGESPVRSNPQGA